MLNFSWEPLTLPRARDFRSKRRRFYCEKYLSFHEEPAAGEGEKLIVQNALSIVELGARGSLCQPRIEDLFIDLVTPIFTTHASISLQTIENLFSASPVPISTVDLVSHSLIYLLEGNPRLPIGN